MRQQLSLSLTGGVRGTRTRDHWFYLGMGALAVLIVLLGFAPSIVNPANRRGPMSTMVMLHSLVFSAWLLLFLVQTTLVASSRTAVHRRLGLLGAALAPAMVVVGYGTAVAAARRGYDLSGDLVPSDPLAQLVFPLGDLISFGVLVSAGFLWRRRAQLHKRLMLLATVGSLMAAPLAHAIGHFQVPQLGGAIIVPALALLYFSSAIHDRVSTGRFHPASVWGGVLLLAWANLRAGLVGPSDAWHRFASWLIG